MKLFSLDSASALLPVVTPLVEDLWKKRRELAIALLENDPALRARSGTTMAQQRSKSRRATELKADIVRIINRIESYGCLVKDLDLGLLDFPALRDGKSIFLCWKAGEPAIEHWHFTDENFYERKAL